MFRLTELLAAAVALLPLLLAVGYAHGPMSRSRLTAFARHHSLSITPDNGDRVIRYLAITRRWRCLGLGVSISATLGWAMLHGGGSVSALGAFAGWFVGALAAELHLAAVRHGIRRTASLRPREYHDYVGIFVWWLLPASVLVILAVLVLLTRRDVVWPLAAAWLAAGTTVLAIVLAVRRRVLLRPQPVAEPDVVRADDEIRSRSLHVLSGGGFALVCFCALGAFDAVRENLDVPGFAVVVWFGALIVGVLSANGRRRRPTAAALA